AVEGDFLLLEYAGNDKLYLPIDRLGLVQRYVGGEGAQPHAAKLGGTGWEKTRSKARKAVEELAAELLEIYAKRQASQGFAFSPPDDLFREFEATFPWEETPDQLSAIMDVLADMQHSRPMDRLVCGDVGYGKTEVALRGAFKAVLDGKQVAVLVPTTILAQQHFETFSNRLKDHPVTVEMLSRFRTTAEQKAILERVKKGEIDIIIGTHRLLQKDVAFKDLGLLIVDEEQRFGVKDKDRLKQYRASVDIMTLTATPIPRTLHMSMMGIRDLSIIDTPPVDRQAIRTVVARDTDELVREAILRELQRDGQVFFVHNRVQSIGLVAERLRRLVPEARIAVAHGQMDEKELEKVMLSFMHGQTDLLLCTTIIESGLDIPRANTMIVDRADTYGLSQLYQLRGRIGRSTVRGEAYLLIPGQAAISQDARERLKIIQEITELGAGFRIATHDLELRGAGDLLGPRQSGAVADIGFEYYNQLLEEAIAQLKGEALEERCEPEINLALPAFIPESYVPDTNQRLVLYKRLVQAESDDEVAETLSEMADRYGRPPQPIITLGQIMQLRISLKRLKVNKIESDGKRLVFSFHPATPVNPELLIGLIRQEPQRYQFTPDHRLLVALPVNASTAETLTTAQEALLKLTA
ncbi:MAG: transcription-repair coupling factor, partial [Geobacter sp.]